MLPEFTKPSNRFGRGFTLIEVVAVLIIMGIVTAVLVGRGSSMSTDLVVTTEALKAHLRYAQNRSMNSNSVWALEFTSTSSYRLVQGAAVRLLPGENQNVVTTPSGITMGWTGTAVYAFDTLGRPCTDSAGATPAAVNRTVTLTTGSENRTITVTRNTGFIP
ncbi:MAG: type II secretion system GspH family protein [Proteobacteria bacterium]|nr:type II secretion system GspH family protein [Pseudomonadota bacterium]